VEGLNMKKEYDSSSAQWMFVRDFILPGRVGEQRVLKSNNEEEDGNMCKSRNE